MLTSRTRGLTTRTARADDAQGAVLTPFTVTTVDTGIALARSPIAADLLQGLSAFGVVGLAVTPGEPRQLLTSAPLFGPDLAGTHLRIIDNPQTAAMVRVLHVVPVTGLTAGQAGDALRQGESNIAAIGRRLHNQGLLGRKTKLGLEDRRRNHV